MATIFKRLGKKAPKGSKYLISWYDYEADKWRVKTAYTDAGLSTALGQRLERESAERREGFTSSVREESIAPIEGPLQQFLTHCRAKKRNAGYISQMERRIRRVLNEIGAKRLLDLDAGKVEEALMKMKTRRGFEGKGQLLSVTTRNEYITSLQTFTKWAIDRRKLEFDPLTSLVKADELNADRVHPRRALPPEDLVKLLHSAAERPAAELLIIRTGKNKGQIGAKVRPDVLERARKKGNGRRMAYLVAIWTGLRRSELKKLEWRDVLLDVKVPYIQRRFPRALID